ncbi:hypothetical protein [Arthrobacter echini]|nr:hypothetical protein [Arthrobacter echini]
MPDYPQFLHTVLDTTDVRGLAEEPLYVHADPAGHPFCIFVA